MGTRPGQRRKYIRNVARTWMQRHKIKSEAYHHFTSLTELLHTLQDEWGVTFHLEVSELTDETLGKLAAAGQPDDSGRMSMGMGVSLHDINGRDPQWLNGRWRGLDLLQNIAASAVLAAVCNLIIEEHPYKHRLKDR